MSTTTQPASATKWEAGRAHSAHAQVPVKIPGGPVVKTTKLVWRGVIHRKIDGRGVMERCPHNHLKRSAAEGCGGLAARRMNRLAAKDHEAWPAESSPIRGQFGPVRPALYWDGKVSERSYPLTARCQPCGWPITLPMADAEWEHVDYEPAPAEGGVVRDTDGTIMRGPSLPCGCPLDSGCTGYHPGRLS